MDIEFLRVGEKKVVPVKGTFLGEGEIEGAVVFEGGMVSGKTSVSFAIKVPAHKRNGELVEDGYYVVQTSAAILRTLVSGIDGAEIFWRANPRK